MKRNGKWNCFVIKCKNKIQADVILVDLEIIHVSYDNILLKCNMNKSAVINHYLLSHIPLLITFHKQMCQSQLCIKKITPQIERRERRPA